MNIHLKPGRIVPKDHVEYLIARYGWWQILRACLSLGLRRGRQRLRAKKAGPRGKPPVSAHLRRDIGLAPEPPQTPRYWELR